MVIRTLVILFLSTLAAVDARGNASDCQLRYSSFTTGLNQQKGKWKTFSSSDDTVCWDNPNRKNYYSFKHSCEDHISQEQLSELFELYSEIENLCFARVRFIRIQRGEIHYRSNLAPKEIFAWILGRNYDLSDIGTSEAEVQMAINSMNSREKINRDIRSASKFQRLATNSAHLVNFDKERILAEELFAKTRRGQGPNPFKDAAEMALAREKSCSTIDFRGQFKGKKVRDQSRAGWCTHYVAADFASFYSNETMSATSSAMNDYEASRSRGKKDYNKFHTGSQTSQVFAQMFTHGLCSEKEMPSVETMNQSHRDDSVRDTLAKKYGYGSDPKQFTRAYRHYKYHLNLTAESTKLQSRLNSFNKTCRKKINFPPFKLTETKGTRDHDLKAIQAIDSALEAGHPSVAEYNTDMLRDGIDLKNLLDKYNAKHVSLIVGRKYNKALNQCEYILRNSWGVDACGRSYNKKYKCDAHGNVFIPRREVLYSAEKVHSPTAHGYNPNVDIDPPEAYVDPKSRW